MSRMHHCDARHPRARTSPTSNPLRSITIVHGTPSHFATNQKGDITTIRSKSMMRLAVVSSPPVASSRECQYRKPLPLSVF
jgi:hypothetical protein